MSPAFLASASASLTPKPLAQVLTRRAIDLAAISLVLIAGLTAGREIVAWWRDDGSATATPLTDPQAAWSNRPVDIHFGDSSSYARLPYRGSSAEAITALIQQLQQRAVPADSLPPPNDDEKAWIETLQKLTPAETVEAAAKIYVVPSIFPTVAATVSVIEQDAEVTRLAGWGMALPAGEEVWTLFVFSPSSQNSSPMAGLRLPAKATRLFGFNDERGQGVLAFRGPGRIPDWLAHFDAEFGARIAAGNSESACWRHDGRQFDMQFSAAGEEITALLWMTTAPTGHNTAR